MSDLVDGCLPGAVRQAALNRLGGLYTRGKAGAGRSFNLATMFAKQRASQPEPLPLPPLPPPAPAVPLTDLEEETLLAALADTPAPDQAAQAAQPDAPEQAALADAPNQAALVDEEALPDGTEAHWQAALTDAAPAPTDGTEQDDNTFAVFSLQPVPQRSRHSARPADLQTATNNGTLGAWKPGPGRPKRAPDCPTAHRSDFRPAKHMELIKMMDALFCQKGYSRKTVFKTVATAENCHVRTAQRLWDSREDGVDQNTSQQQPRSSRKQQPPRTATTQKQKQKHETNTHNNTNKQKTTQTQNYNRTQNTKKHTKNKKQKQTETKTTNKQNKPNKTAVLGGCCLLLLLGCCCCCSRQNPTRNTVQPRNASWMQAKPKRAVAQACRMAARSDS